MSKIDATQPTMPADHPHHLPYGVFSPGSQTGASPRLGVRIGAQVLDLGAAAAQEARSWARLLSADRLNPLLAAGPAVWAEVRDWLIASIRVVQEEHGPAAVVPGGWRQHLHDLSTVRLHLPLRVADYVDFYASEHHASNVGAMFRPDDRPLTPNWKHLPIGYHGRSSTILVSGTDIRRPLGQTRPNAGPASQPGFGPTRRLDFEAELAFIVGGATRPGDQVTLARAEDHLFGVALFNDWSARDIQAWEYVPLGPFLGKSFGSSLAAWVTPVAALEHARVPLPAQDPAPLPYLREPVSALHSLNIALRIEINGHLVSTPNYRSIYWSPTQMLAHLTVNGAAISNGDLFASGTISGADPSTRGCLLELSWNGTTPIRLGDGAERTFLEDGDTVRITASAPGPGDSGITLGEVVGTVRGVRD